LVLFTGQQDVGFVYWSAGCWCCLLVSRMLVVFTGQQDVGGV
jgi:hypothetical protein